MRRFSDDQGTSWDVVAGRESWGTIVAIFIPRRSGGGTTEGSGLPGIRQTTLDAAGYGQANEELSAMSDEELRRLLARSAPKQTG